MNGDRPSNRLTCAHQCQSTRHRRRHMETPPHNQKKETKDDETNKEGTNRTRVLTGCGREQTVISFQNFTQNQWNAMTGAYHVSLGYGGTGVGEA